MTTHADIAIIGGGFTGAALANALADGKRRIVVVEARTTPAPRFAGELLHPSRLDVLDRALLLKLRARGADVLGFAVMPAGGGPAQLLPYAVASAQPGLGIEHDILVEELRAAAAARPGVEFWTGSRGEVEFEWGRAVGVRCEDGRTVTAELVLGAEGRHSTIRSQLHIPFDKRLLSFTAALRVEGTLPHPGYGHVFLGAPGPILAYPIGAGAIRMCFDLPLGGENRPAHLPARILREYGPSVPEPLRAQMRRALGAGGLQLAANHAIATGTCIAPGLALVGDAGGCAHPLTAAGMSVCLNDVGILAEELHDRFEPEALRRFQSRRYAFARTRAELTDALYDLFTHCGPGASALQNALFRHWGRSPEGLCASVGLLAGEESRPSVLRREWAAVLGRALLDAARSPGRFEVLRDVVRFAAPRIPSLLRL
jgi:2-polyprenyl-6-methoxyphenol hydroxylase-like FAD-dependent oxidoreductase